MQQDNYSEILERITTMRRDRNWSEYQLAEKAGMTQSTISSWYNKNMLPCIPSLDKICKAFDISLSQFFWDPNDEVAVLSAPQKKLLEASRKLEPKQIDALIGFIKTL